MSQQQSIKEMDTLSRETTLSGFYHSSGKGSKRISSCLEQILSFWVDPLSEGIFYESKQEVTEIVSFVNMAENLPSVYTSS